MARNPVAETILAQLGGHRFVAMTGATSFTSGPACLTFRLPRQHSPKRIFGVRIELTDADLYTMVFLTTVGSMRKGNFEVREAAKHEGIYADMLREIFTAETGLHTSL